MPPPAPYTLPTPGEDWITGARQRYLRRTARLLLAWPHPLPAWLARPYEGLREALGRVLAARPADLYAALALPQVGAPLHAGSLAEAVPALLAELSRRRAIGREGVFWAAPVKRILCPGTGAALELVPERVGMLFADGEIELGASEVWDLRPRGERAFLPMREGGWLALVDDNPLAMVEAHPDKEGNALSLGSATAAEWLAALDGARALVRAASPALADEHRSLLATVVPVGGPMEKSLSASYREAVGTVYVSLHPSPAKMAEALIHELQHTKLNLLTFVDPVLADGGDELHASPVRPDPRPLWGVLLAVHAFVPVAELYFHLGDRARLAEVIAQNREAMGVVARHARPTEVGRRLIEGLARVVDEQEARFRGA
ncbi:MAG: aKG-HExxH-type peptide beta-hydroxylase [Myxococcota bacterium]